MSVKTITELPTSTVKLITATQIATSVSNIVKELIENSLDAGSTIIRVKLENSGLSKIEVTDNGCGVSKEDVEKMALPHYTSKISTHEDLESLVTYGFRGEALAAACAIGKLSVTTKTAEDAIAYCCTMDNSGKVIDSKPSHLSQGTQITLSSLFWNLPVRKQFYQTVKRKKEEIAKVEDLLLQYGLIHPELHLSFHHDSALVWQKTRVSSFKSNVIQILGHTVCSDMEFIEEEEPFHMFMMFPKRAAQVETCFRQKADRCFVFINQRPVIHKDIEKLMKELYVSVQDPNQKSSLYPVFLLSLQVPSDELDVNLEPNKTQVLLKKQVEVLERIKDLITRVIDNQEIYEIRANECSAEEDKLDSESLAVYQNIRDEQLETQLDASAWVERIDITSCVNETQFSEDATPDKEPVSRKSSFEITINEDILEDDDLFHGFNEPFLDESDDLRTRKSKKSFAPPVVDVGPEGFPAVGSEEWAKGWARGPDGNFIHPVQVLRHQPHFAKRISEPPAPGSASKKARLDCSVNSSFNETQQQSLLERVNNYARKNAPDPFGEYCREKKCEFLSQDPSMSFTDLSQKLNQGWKNLSKRERESYSAGAAPQGHQFNTTRSNPPKMSAIKGNLSLDRFLVGQQSPTIRTSAPRMSLSAKTSSMEIDFSFELLAASLGSVASLRRPEWTCLKKLEQGGWLCTNGEEVMAVNFTRLFEMILYSRLANDFVLPSKPLNNPISIDARTLMTQKVWDILTSLPSEYITPTSSYVVDPRIVSNGLKVRIFSDPSGSGVQVVEVPADINSFDLGDVMKLLLRLAKEESTVETCRPDQIIKFLEEEAARLASGRCTDPDSAEVSSLLTQWLSGDPENACLHGEPIVWSYVIASTTNNSTGLGDCEDYVLDE